MRDPTRRELIKLSASFAARAKTIRRTTKDETLANLYDVASRVALERPVVSPIRQTALSRLFPNYPPSDRARTWVVIGFLPRPVSNVYGSRVASDPTGEISFPERGE